MKNLIKMELPGILGGFKMGTMNVNRPDGILVFYEGIFTLGIMNLRVDVEWLYTGLEEESLDYSRVLYAYLHPDTNKILYLGKADRCSVYERMRGSHKEAILDDIVIELGVSELHVIVGLLSLPSHRRFSSELLADVESLLIFELQPTYNIQSRQSRISRPGLVVQCFGDWPMEAKTFRDE